MESDLILRVVSPSLKVGESGSANVPVSASLSGGISQVDMESDLMPRMAWVVACETSMTGSLGAGFAGAPEAIGSVVLGAGAGKPNTFHAVQDERHLV